MTPAQLSRHLKATAESRIDELRRDVSLAWHVAAFTRTKKLKPLASFLRKIRKPGARVEKPRMTWQAMEAAAKAWVRASGGRFLKRGDPK